MIADRLPSQKVKENSERSPGRDCLFTGRIVLLPHPFIPPPIYMYPTCMRSRGAARATLAGTRRNLIGVDQIGFHPSLQDSTYRGILLILLLHAFICQIYKICLYLCLIRLNLNILHAFHLEILCIGKARFSFK